MLSFEANFQDSLEPLSKDQFLGFLENVVVGFNADRVVQAFLFELGD